jgi:hypothetical protein
MRKITSQQLIKKIQQGESLPENLSVGGYLYLEGTQITSLPENLSVGGSLYLEGTQITSLPGNLSVGGYLDLEGTQITNIEWLSEPVGNHGRKGPVFMNNGAPHISLGCFNGTQGDAVIAIRLKYGNDSRYEHVVTEAFARFREKHLGAAA